MASHNRQTIGLLQHTQTHARRSQSEREHAGVGTPVGCADRIEEREREREHWNNISPGSTRKGCGDRRHRVGRRVGVFLCVCVYVCHGLLHIGGERQPFSFGTHHTDLKEEPENMANIKDEGIDGDGERKEAGGMEKVRDMCVCVRACVFTGVAKINRTK